jgi:hypothetical protein
VHHRVRRVVRRQRLRTIRGPAAPLAPPPPGGRTARFTSGLIAVVVVYLIVSIRGICLAKIVRAIGCSSGPRGGSPPAASTPRRPGALTALRDGSAPGIRRSTIIGCFAIGRPAVRRTAIRTVRGAIIGPANPGPAAARPAPTPTAVSTVQTV